MNEPRSIRRRGLRPMLLLGLIALLLGLLAPPEAAPAHLLDVYLQATYIVLAASNALPVSRYTQLYYIVL
jgi:hypothetical protein